MEDEAGRLWHEANNEEEERRMTVAWMVVDELYPAYWLAFPCTHTQLDYEPDADGIDNAWCQECLRYVRRDGAPVTAPGLRLNMPPELVAQVEEAWRTWSEAQRALRNLAQTEGGK